MMTRYNQIGMMLLRSFLVPDIIIHGPQLQIVPTTNMFIVQGFQRPTTLDCPAKYILSSYGFPIKSVTEVKTLTKSRMSS